MTKSEEAKAALDLLTRKQRQIALMLANGLGTPEIAEQLCVTEDTIKTHRYNTYKALGIKKAVQLGVILGMAGLVTDWRAPA
ncbi:MAG: LuxR C-terminal-related transcriptional regulator [Moraxellaceae bacterium]